MFTGRRNVLVLAFSQALMLSVIVMSVTLGAVLGSLLAPDRNLATLPIAMLVVGTAIASLPAAFLMRRHGRRVGFVIGIALGLSGSLLCALALQQSSFPLFVAGHLLLGGYQGFANNYRLAARSKRPTPSMPAGRSPGLLRVAWWPHSWGRNWRCGDGTGPRVRCSWAPTWPRPHSA